MQRAKPSDGYQNWSHRGKPLLIPVTHDPGVQRGFGAGKGPGHIRKAGGFIFKRSNEEKKEKK